VRGAEIFVLISDRVFELGKCGSDGFLEIRALAIVERQISDLDRSSGSTGLIDR